MILALRPDTGELANLAAPTIRDLHLEPGVGFRGRLGPLNLAEAVIQVGVEAGTLEVRVVTVRGKVGPVSVKLPSSQWQPVVRKAFGAILPTLPAWLHGGALPDGAWFGVDGLALRSVQVSADEMRLEV